MFPTEIYVFINVIRPFLKDSTSTCFIFHVLACVCLLLRDCVSAFTRIQITNEQIDELEKKCRDYFILIKLQVFYSSSNCMDFRHHSAGTHKRHEIDVWSRFGFKLHGGKGGQAHLNLQIQQKDKLQKTFGTNFLA